jgi:hypothetical protein
MTTQDIEFRLLQESGPKPDGRYSTWVADYSTWTIGPKRLWKGLFIKTGDKKYENLYLDSSVTVLNGEPMDENLMMLHGKHLKLWIFTSFMELNLESQVKALKVCLRTHEDQTKCVIVTSHTFNPNDERPQFPITMNLFTKLIQSGMVPKGQEAHLGCKVELNNICTVKANGLVFVQGVLTINNTTGHFKFDPIIQI